jgi:FixJ family two-component response regulator
MVTTGRGGMVTVIDDDTAVLNSLRFLLEVAGHRVAAYSSPAEFLSSGQREADCMIIDQHMPQMTGLELVAQLEDSSMRRNIMLITGSSTPDIRNRAAALGIAKVVEKPSADDELLDFVNACTAGLEHFPYR